jgi:hypothetical protein
MCASAMRTRGYAIARLLTEEINKATEEKFETWVKYQLETCEEGSIIGK